MEQLSHSTPNCGAESVGRSATSFAEVAAAAAVGETGEHGGATSGEVDRDRDDEGEALLRFSQWSSPASLLSCWYDRAFIDSCCDEEDGEIDE